MDNGLKQGDVLKYISDMKDLRGFADFRFNLFLKLFSSFPGFSLDTTFIPDIYIYIYVYLAYLYLASTTRWMKAEYVGEMMDYLGKANGVHVNNKSITQVMQLAFT